jgi:hypothetical protein
MLLLQYLFLRNPICPHCHLSRYPGPNVLGSPTLLQRRGILRRSKRPTTRSSTTEETKRPFTTYGEGGEYQSLYPNESVQTSSFQSNGTVNGHRISLHMPNLDTRPMSMQDTTRHKQLDLSSDRPGSRIIPESPLSRESESTTARYDSSNNSQRPSSEGGIFNKRTRLQSPIERRRYSDRLSKADGCEVQGKLEPVNNKHKASISAHLWSEPNSIQSSRPFSSGDLNLSRAKDEITTIVEEKAGRV